MTYLSSSNGKIALKYLNFFFPLSVFKSDDVTQALQRSITRGPKRHVKEKLANDIEFFILSEKGQFVG